MIKKKINIIVNTKVGYDSYVKFLSEKYDVNVIDCLKWNGETISLVLFTGGEDVCPQYYSQNVGEYTKYNLERDKFEKEYLFNNFPDVPKLGCCRGSQFLTVLSGGRLIQHVEGHATGQLHAIEMNGPLLGNIYNITSTHHQMMYPFKMKEDSYQLVAFSKYFLSGVYLNGDNENIELPKDFLEPEIVYYPKTKSLCIQGHPEMTGCPNDTKDMVFRMIDYFLKI